MLESLVALETCLAILGIENSGKRKGGVITRDFVVLSDFDNPAGNSRGHYFHQDLLVAQYIFAHNPKRHVDVGSRVGGFVAHVASFRKIDVLDIREMPESQRPNISFIQADLMGPVEVGEVDSVSCLHAVEHFGLGRYNDPIGAWAPIGN